MDNLFQSLKLITIQAINSLVLLTIFIAFFAIKRQLLPASIIFYEGLIFSIIFIFTIWLLLQKYHLMENHTLLPAFLIILLFNSLIPTILDRSVSITVLATLNQCNRECSIEHLEKEFERVYLKKNQAVKKRVLEQISSKNVVEFNGRYNLTNQGKITFEVMNVLTDVFNIDRSYIDQN